MERKINRQKEILKLEKETKRKRIWEDASILKKRIEEDALIEEKKEMNLLEEYAEQVMAKIKIKRKKEKLKKLLNFKSEEERREKGNSHIELQEYPNKKKRSEESENKDGEINKWKAKNESISLNKE